MSKAKKKNLGIVLIVIGAILALTSFLIIFNTIKDYMQEKSDYEEEYDRWQEDWWGNDSSFSSMPDKPSMKVGSMIVGVFTGGISLLLIFTGVGYIATKKFVNNAEQVITSNDFKIDENINITKHCEYCNTKVSIDTTTCPSCGARIK